MTWQVEFSGSGSWLPQIEWWLERAFCRKSARFVFARRTLITLRRTKKILCLGRAPSAADACPGCRGERVEHVLAVRSDRAADAGDCRWLRFIPAGTHLRLRAKGLLRATISTARCSTPGDFKNSDPAARPRFCATPPADTLIMGGRRLGAHTTFSHRPAAGCSRTIAAFLPRVPSTMAKCPCLYGYSLRQEPGSFPLWPRRGEIAP